MMLPYCVLYYYNIIFNLLKNIKRSMVLSGLYGRMAKLVDAPHSKCGDFGCGGSSPPLPTKHKNA